MITPFIAGTAMTPFGRHEGRTLVDLAVEAGKAALENAGLQPGDIDGLELGNFLGQSLHHQGVLASMVSQELGLHHVPTTTVEGACASAGIALRHGVLACQAGAARAVLCLGAELMSTKPVDEVTAGLMEAMDQRTDGAAGLTFPGFFGLVAEAHRTRFGTTREQMAAVTVKNRGHAEGSKTAMFTTPVTVDEVLASRPVADPLRLYDCSPISDGGAAAVVTAGDPGRSATPAIRVLASEQASGPTSLPHIDDLTTFPATRVAAERAFSRAGLSPGDVDVVELHDCFSIAEIVDSEDLGLLPRGEAAAAIAAGATRHGTGRVVINPSGGLLSRGHPVGATGLAQIHEIVEQLRGQAHRQVEDARVGLAHNLGGSGATSTVTILTEPT